MKTSFNELASKAILFAFVILVSMAFASCSNNNPETQHKENAPASGVEKALILPDFPIVVTKESAGCVHLDEVGGIQRDEERSFELTADLSDEEVKKSLGASENADIDLINYMLYVNKKLGDEKSLWYVKEGIKNLVESTQGSKGVFFGATVNTAAEKKRIAQAAKTLAVYYTQFHDDSVKTLIENTLDVLSGRQESIDKRVDEDLELHALVAEALLYGADAVQMASYEALGIDEIDRIRSMVQEKDISISLQTEATIIDAFIEAYEHTGVTMYLEDAELTAARMLENFWSEDAGTFISAFDDEPYICPEMSARAAISLQKLYFLNDDDDFAAKAKKAAELFGGSWYGPVSGKAFYRSDKHPLKVAIIGDKNNKATNLLRIAAVLFFEPDKVVMTVDPMEDDERLAKLPYRAREIPTMYACVEAACSMPVSDPEKVESHLEKFVQKYLYGDESGGGIKGMKLD